MWYDVMWCNLNWYCCFKLLHWELQNSISSFHISSSSLLISNIFSKFPRYFLSLANPFIWLNNVEEKVVPLAMWPGDTIVRCDFKAEPVFLLIIQFEPGIKNNFRLACLSIQQDNLEGLFRMPLVHCISANICRNTINMIWWYNDMKILRYDGMMIWWYHDMKILKYESTMIWWYDDMKIIRYDGSARFVGGWRVQLPVWCLSTPKFLLTPEKIVKISQKYIANPPPVFPQIKYCMTIRWYDDTTI